MDMRGYEARQDGFTVSTDPAHLDRDMIANFLANEAYWSPGIDRATVERAIDGSLTFGLYDTEGRQVGFARVITDATRFAYLCDLFVLASHRGKGLGRFLAEAILGHPELATIAKWLLTTADAHGLYAQLGFRALARPDKIMERVAKGR
ncbi:GNAT family N-acetyltransferase [Consotaella salsifontis]|uniref:Acetyltransferase (GNAT) domain-containing protein n=1 Tax=Consotaella salsifontis TaxID=1365950 RepID=A0A1T4QYA6_9HYPH|nr:GNAT family N-acetyltransferase [Consotaella salsifontis]SKA08616.1 Acetyltransferase (GNAT) domain-containing protein [Consotaella salsifontis]